MNLNHNIEKLEVFYDGTCPLCCKFSLWLRKQTLRRGVELVCQPYQSEQSQVLFPTLLDYEPDKLLVVRINQDQVVRGEQAWVYCLYACKKYEPLATKMSQQPWLSLAQKMALTVAQNRYSISKLLNLKAKDINQVSCKDETCS